MPIDYAATGFPASPLLVGSGRTLPAPLPGGRRELPGPRPAGPAGRRPGAARARCRRSPRRGVTGFYGGEFGDRPAGARPRRVHADDLARPLAEWVAPLGLRLWDHDLWTVPPPSQGYLTLAGAWLAERDGPLDDPDDGSWAVALVAAAIAAGRDRPALLWEGADGVELLDPARLAAGSARGPVGGCGRAERPRATGAERPPTPRTCAPSTGGAWACRSSSRTRSGSAATSSSRGPGSTSTTEASGSPSCPATPRSTGPVAARPTRSRPHS